MASMSKARCRVAAAAAALMLGACGGGGGTYSGNGNLSAVTTLSASPVRYGQSTVVTVNGSGLDKGITLDTGGPCTGMSTVQATDAATSFRCQFAWLGEFNMTVKDATGKQLATLLINVPAPQVTVSTPQGSFVIELDVAATQTDVDKFLAYVNAGFYASTLMHRVEAGVAITGGAYIVSTTTDFSLKTTGLGDGVALQSNNGLKNLRGTVAMVADPTASNAAAPVRSRFTINLRDNPDRDYVSPEQPGQAVIGRVVSGMDVVDAIGALPTRFSLAAGLDHVPTTNVTLTVSQTR